MSFNDDGTPAGVEFTALSDDVAAHSTIIQTGQTTTTTYHPPSSPTDSTTESITVREAYYLPAHAHLVYDYAFTGTMAGLPYHGTGSQTYDWVLVAGVLSYTTTCTYDITETINGLNFVTLQPEQQVITSHQVTECSATLTKQ
jgi:hypothetical protein